MTFDQLLSGSRWEILKELARQPQSTTELAKTLHTSAAHISQQLKQLELAGVVQRNRTKKQRVHYTYSIAREMYSVTHVSSYRAEKKDFSADPMQMFIAVLLTMPHALPLVTFLLSKQELTRRFIAIGVLDRQRPELFVLAQDVGDIRQHHANTTVDVFGKTETVVVWSHTPQEVREGLERQDNYFVHALRDIMLTYDPEGILHGVTNE